MKKNKGITIIGLILTIIIMLILIGVVIQILINGKIFEDAEKAGNKYITSSGDEASNTTVTIGGKQYDSIDDYFGSNKKIKVTIKLHDEINGVDAGTGTAVLEETAVLNSENLVLPTGYELYSNIDSSVSNPTVTIENGKATENEYTVKVIKRNNNNIVIENVIGFNKIHLFLNEKYVLANDIDLSEYNQWTPIGWTDSDDVEFTGELDGNGKTISTLKCDYSSNSASNVGLFAINAGTYVNDDLGYTPGGTSSISGVYTFATTTKTGLTSIPSEFNSNIWNMNGHTYSSCPNLVNNAN